MQQTKLDTQPATGDAHPSVLTPQSSARGLLYVSLAVGFFATSPVFTLVAGALDPLIISSGRLVVAAVALGLAAFVAGRAARRAEGAAASGPGRPPRTVVLRFLGYGAIAALHFVCYTASLSYTTPAQALAIVYTAPIFVALFAALFLGEPVRRRQWAGIAVTVLGIVVLALGKPDPAQASHPLLGNALALGAAIAYGLYSIAGRYERAHTPLLPYAARVYGAAALWLLPVTVLAWPADVGAVPPLAWGAILGLGLLPLALGHTLYNASLRRIPATLANVIATQEVTGGVLLSWLLLNVVPAGNEIVGALITLLGILIVLL